MTEIKDFYESGKGDHLIDPLFFPEEIRQFLICEKRILEALADSFDLLVEVGSMYGRYLKWAIGDGKCYFGIDVVERYIEAGRKIILDSQLDPIKYKFVLGGAENITELVRPDEWSAKPNRCILFFPFNSFGNMNNPLTVIRGIRKSGLPFLISTYGTSEEINICREKYYKNCGYSKIISIQDKKGVRFTSPDGLNTIAYHLDYLQNAFVANDLKVTVIPFSKIGTAFVSSELAEKIVSALPQNKS